MAQRYPPVTRADANLADTRRKEKEMAMEYDYDRPMSHKERIGDIAARAESKKGDAQVAQAKIAGFQTSFNTARILWPILITAILLFAFIGPAFGAVLSIFSSISWYVWILIIVILLIWWRNRR